MFRIFYVSGKGGEVIITFLSCLMLDRPDGFLNFLNPGWCSEDDIRISLPGELTDPVGHFSGIKRETDVST